MKENSKYKKVLDTLRKFCSKGEKSKADVLKKLSYYDLSADQEAKIFETLKEESFVDERRYAEAFINDKLKFNKWGKMKIVQALRLKMIPEDIINESVHNIDDKEYMQILDTILKQKRKQINHTDANKIKTGLIRFALGRGFEYEKISQVLRLVDR